jgi:hypothetical protein
MFILIVVGWISILAGGLAVLVGLSTEELTWVALGISSAISGVLFLAINRALELLTDIRSALVEEKPTQPTKVTSFDKAFLEDQ